MNCADTAKKTGSVRYSGIAVIAEIYRAGRLLFQKLSVKYGNLHDAHSGNLIVKGMQMAPAFQRNNNYCMNQVTSE